MQNLVTFGVVARLPGFPRAAPTLYCAQPKVSAQLQVMEEKFGLRLIPRLGRGDPLTAAGQRLNWCAGRHFLGQGDPTIRAPETPCAPGPAPWGVA